MRGNDERARKGALLCSVPLGPLTTLSGVSEADNNDFDRAIFYESLVTMIEDAHLAGNTAHFDWAGGVLLAISGAQARETDEVARPYLAMAADVYDQQIDEDERRQRMELAVERGLLS